MTESNYALLLEEDKNEEPLSIEDEVNLLRKKLKVFENEANRADVIEAENQMLKMEIEKLNCRSRYSKIEVPEDDRFSNCDDVDYLQKTINNLRRELVALKSIESDCAQLRVENATILQELRALAIPHQPTPLEIVTEERDHLRRQIEKMLGLEDQIIKLKECASNCENFKIDRDSLLEQNSHLSHEKLALESKIASLLQKVTDYEKSLDDLRVCIAK